MIGTKNNRGYADAVSMMDHVRDLLATLGGRTTSPATPLPFVRLTSRSGT